MAQGYYMLIYFILLTHSLVVRAETFRSRCLAFQPENFTRSANLTVLEHIQAGTNLSLSDNVASCNRGSQVVSSQICRVALSVPTSKRSSITLELWLPEDWTGRFLATGNGGIDGCIKYEDLAYGSSTGFATVGANNGHNGTTLVTALYNEDVVIDFAHRSLHTATRVGKDLVKHFYNRKQKKSYSIGCSLGGRQGIDAVDKYPDDFDGILVGAPAVDFNDLYSWRASFFPLTGSSTDPDFIQPSWWKTLIHDEVIRQCDDIDGVRDGIIEDPMVCNFDPAALLCSKTKSTDCLSEPQVEIVRKIYSPYTYPDGRLIFPGMQLGNEISAADGLYAGKPFAYSEDWFQNVIYSDPAWDPATYNTKDAAVADAKNPAEIRTWPSDLHKFRQRGGKVLTYHGLQDQQITSYNTPRFYSHLQNDTRMSYREMDEWFRFFRISGMNHCSGGPGGWVLGQGGNAAAAGIGFEPDSNVLAALVEWVENGKAPDTMTGTRFVNDTVPLGVQLRRRHCRWPKRNLFKGGDASQPDSWHCVDP